MTHGDKEKAKAAKSSKASGKKAGENGKSKAVSQAQSGKAPSKGSKEAGSKTGKAAGKNEGSAKTGVEKQKSSASDTKAKNNAAPAENGGFANPVIAAAFKQALKKYPNALRKLTD
jgi:hypothetical protein